MFFSHLQEADLHSSTGEPWLIPVIIGILVSLVVSLILLVRFCCVRPAAHKKLLKAAELGVPRPDLLHPSLQFDNKVHKKIPLVVQCSGSMTFWCGSGSE